MQTKITFANSSIDLDVLHHENMHQWWGDNVSEASYNLTFFKEGLATFGEFLYAARIAPSFEQSLVSSFDSIYDNTKEPLWDGAPSDPRPATLFSGSKTYDRPGISYIALRAILGPANFDAALQELQQAYRQSSITEPQLEAGFAAHLPSQTASCRAQLAAFFSQWWDTVYPTASGLTRPSITGPGLEGGGFRC
jgi:aminopeptidase N